MQNYIYPNGWYYLTSINSGSTTVNINLITDNYNKLTKNNFKAVTETSMSQDWSGITQNPEVIGVQFSPASVSYNSSTGKLTVNAGDIFVMCQQGNTKHFPLTTKVYLVGMSK